jgi:hypothetical protein
MLWFPVDYSLHFRRSYNKDEEVKEDTYSSHYIHYGQQFTPTVSDGEDVDTDRPKGRSVFDEDEDEDGDEAHRSMYMAIVRSATEEVSAPMQCMYAPYGYIISATQPHPPIYIHTYIISYGCYSGQLTFSSTEILSKMREENSVIEE